MSNNLESDRSVSTGKMYPIDLAPQKITIVKGVSNSDVKMAHLISGQTKTTNSNQHGPHASQTSGIMRSSLAQIISSNSTSQPQMIVSGSPILQGTQILSQGSQLHGQSTQIINQSQLITPSGQIISPGTQIISQGTQLSAQVVSTNSGSSGSVQSNVVSPGGTQVLSMGSQLASGASNLVVNSSVRTLPQTVRVLPPQPLHNSRPVQLSTVNVTNASNVLVSKNVNVGVTSHVPRGLAAGASLAMRPVAPSAASQPASNQGSGWGTSRTARGALVYGPRGRTTHTLGPHTPTINSSSVISGTVRGVSPRPSTPVAAPTTLTPRPLPLLQRNYQPAKPAGPGGVGPRGAVGNSAPAQLYYEVPRAARPPPHAHGHAAHVNVINAAVQSVPDNRPPPSAVQTVPVLARPTILRKRDVDGSPTKAVQPPPVLSYPAESVCPAGPPGWEDVCSAGSTTESAASSPARDLDRDLDLEPRKKPRKQLLSNEVRQCDYPPEDPPSSPPQVTINPPPKRPLLRSQFVCGWRSTALHFARPADVRRREPKPRDIVSIASQRHVLSSADGWKVHHLTAQMDDLMSLESDVGLQLAGLLRTLETASGKALSALQPQSHTLLELLKGNIQRSKIVCEGIQEARQDILRVFTHRKSVSDILARQADKRCFRKHRSQS